MQNRSDGAFVPVEHFFSPEAVILPWKDSFDSSNKIGAFLPEELFADVFAAWSELGLYFLFQVQTDAISVIYPEVHKGDSVELFIDTKNLKKAKITHRFCHHFYFLPERTDGVLCKEVTRFRSDDSHPLVELPEESVLVKRKKRGYEMQLFIPAHCMTGYQPEIGQRIGFTYRVNRAQLPSQHFAVSCTDLASHPHLWGTFHIQG